MMTDILDGGASFLGEEDEKLGPERDVHVSGKRLLLWRSGVFR